MYLEVRPLQTVAVCCQRIERGASLSEANVAVERRAAEPGQAAAAPAGAVLGKFAKRPLQPGQVIVASTGRE